MPSNPPIAISAGIRQPWSANNQTPAASRPSAATTTGRWMAGPTGSSMSLAVVMAGYSSSEAGGSRQTQFLLIVIPAKAGIHA